MPQISQLRRFAVPITGTAMVAGMLLVGSPASAVQSQFNFSTSCQAKALITVDKVTTSFVTVDAPTSVAPGETFTIRMQSNGQSFPNSDSGATTTNLSRLKNDFDVPANATFISAAIVPGTSFNLENVAPSVIRINEAGSPDAAGPYLRISGNNEVIGNSPSTSTNSEGGIRAPKTKKNLDGSTNTNGDSWFRMPAIDITMIAGASGVIQPKVRTAGDAATYGNDKNFNTQLAKASLLGTQWAPTRCTPRDAKGSALNAGAGPLATISIASAPVDVETTTSLSVPATAITGTAVDLTATVAPNNAVGTVQFKSNGTAIGSPVTVSGGVATLSHAFDAAGAQSVTADFTAGAGFVSSSAPAQTVTVSDPAPVDVETTTSLSVPATAVTGTAVDLTATVAPNNAVGTVQFKSNGTVIGSPVTVSGGVATLSHAFDAAGAQSVTADFTAGAGFVSSSAPAQTVTVSDPAPVDVETTTSLSVPATAITGTAVDLTATVAPNTAVGTVQFKSNGTAIGSPVTVTGGVATLSHAFDAAGAQSVTADFTAGAGFVSSSAPAQTVTVSDPAPVDVETTTSLSVPATAITGTAVDLTATVAPNNAVGTVQFKSNGTAIGSPVTVTGGVATLSHAFDAAGAQSVTADFIAGAGFVSSSAPAQTVTVSDPAPVDVETTTSLSVPATAITGAAVDLTATVAPNNAVGTVQFKSNGTAIGSPVTVTGGVATLSHAFDVAGAQSVTADFTAGAGFVSSSAPAQTVTVSDPAPVDVETTTSLSVPATAVTGAAVDLTATVAPNNAVGTVQFKSNGTAIGSPVTVTGGVATLSHSFDVAGAQSVTADFTAGAGFVSSSAPAQTVTVSDPAPVDKATKTVLSVQGEAKVGLPVDLFATVSEDPSDALVPSGGTVQFKIGGVDLGAPVAVVDGVAKLPHVFGAEGTFAVSAAFSGSGVFTSSAAESVDVNVTVPTPSDVESSTSLTAPSSAKVGTAVQLKAVVSSSGATSGTVQFFDGTTPIGTAVDVVGGQAVLSHTFTTTGNHSITAVYSGAQGVTGSTSTASVVNVGNGGGGSGSLGSLSLPFGS
uniref:beta strand repeat-containing protein n=1 Tax=Rhodococcus qingshengii TaxID=334542 RepID=UPI003FEF36EE